MSRKEKLKNKKYPTTRRDFKEKLQKKCVSCKYNQNGYCTKHNAIVNEAIGICSTEENDIYITYNNIVRKMPKALDVDGHIKKQSFGPEHYSKIYHNQLRKKQLDACRQCEHFGKDGWCTQTKTWCINSTKCCNTLINISKTYKLKKRKKKK